MSNDLDITTLEHVFNRLDSDGEREAALKVASMAFDEITPDYTVEDFLDEHYADLEKNKIRIIKKVRAEFNLGLKEAKAEVDAYEEKHSDPDEWVSVEAYDLDEGMTVRLDEQSEHGVQEVDRGARFDLCLRGVGWVGIDNHTVEARKSDLS